MAIHLFRYNLGVTERVQKIGERLAFMIPLTPWPLAMWFQSQPDYQYSVRHAALALHSVASQIFFSVIATTAIGLVLVASCRRSPQVFFGWLALATFNAYLLLQYLERNSAVYD